VGLDRDITLQGQMDIQTGIYKYSNRILHCPKTLVSCW